MAEKRDWNAKMNAKGLEQTITEEQAKHMALHQGATYLFIVQAHSGPKVVNEDGSEKVNLIPDLVELIPAEHAERLRRYQRALYLTRPEQFGQQAFEEATPGERDVDAAVGDVEALVETDDKGEPTGIWDPTSEVPADPEIDACDYPGCLLESEHDGDHVQAPEGSDEGNVVAFSGKS